MHDRPKDPSGETPEFYKPQVGYSIRPAYDGEIALVPIPEWFGFPASSYTTTNDISNVLTLLDGGLSYSWHHHRIFRFSAQQISRRSNDISCVADCEDFWMSRHQEAWADNDFKRPDSAELGRARIVGLRFCSATSPSAPLGKIKT
jgi:hypothetical protein